MQLTTALVVSGGGLQGAAIIKSLRAVGGVRILVADCHEENVGCFEADGYFVAPLLSNVSAFTSFLHRVCREEAVDHLFPITDLELEIFSREKQALELAGTRVWVCSPAVLEVARNKLHLARWLQAHGLPTLPTASTPEGVGVAGPLLGKPLAGYGSKGIVKVASLSDALALPQAQREGLAWQVQLPAFDEYSIDLAIAGPGQVSPTYLRRRIRTSGGFAVLCEPSNEPRVSDIAQRTALALSQDGALGLINLQVLVAGEEAVVSDFNARAGMSLPLTLAAGGNPLALLLDAECGEQASGPDVRTVRVLSERLLKRPPLEQVQGVVFDLDDTLFDQKDWIHRKLRMLWQAEKHWLPSEVEFLRATMAILEEGERAKLFDVYAHQTGLNETQRMTLINVYRNARPRTGRLYPDVNGALAQLRRRGLRLGLLTDNPASSQRDKLLVTQLEPAFHAVVLTGDLGTPKPARQAFASAAEGLGLRPEQVVMVGDHLFRDSLGSLEAGYAHAFHLQRDGAFFNFDLTLCRPLLPVDRLTALTGLQELDWYLRKS